MVTYDFSPFYRSTIGFDRMAQFLENAARVSELDNSYPPYNIESVGEDHYRVTVAVAGFSPDELEIEVRENVLYISGAKGEESGEGLTEKLRGTTGRLFRQHRRDDLLPGQADFHLLPLLEERARDADALDLRRHE